MANRLITPEEVAASLKKSIEDALATLDTDEQKREFLDAVSASFFGMPMEMGGVRATDEVDATLS